MFYNIALVSTIQQYESAIHMYVCTYIHTYIYLLLFGFPSHLSHCGAFPVLYSSFLFVIYFIHSINKLYLSIPISQFISPPPLSSLVQFSSSVMSNSLRHLELQHARPPCPSPTPRVYSNPCPLSRWCHPTISSSVKVRFSSRLQSFPASGAFQMSQLFTSGGRSIGVSASTTVLPMIIQDWFPLGWTSWISLQSKGLRSLLQHHGSKASIFQCSAFFIVQLSHLYMTTGKTIALTRWTFVDTVMSLLFNILSRLVITFLLRSKRLLISWLQSPSAVILEPQN